MMGEIKDWRPYFDSADSKEQRHVIAKALADFLNSSEAKRLDMPGKCMIGSKTAWPKATRIGDYSVTPRIERMERMKSGKKNGNPHDLIRAIATTGEEYQFYSDEYDPRVYLLLSDLETGHFDDDPCFLT